MKARCQGIRNPHAFTWCFLRTHFFSHAEKVTILVCENQISHLWGFVAISLHIHRILLTKRVPKAWRPAKFHYPYLRKLWDIHKTDGKAYIILQPPSHLPTLEVSMQRPALFNCVFCVQHTPPPETHFLLQMGGFETWVGTQLQDQVIKISLLSGILLGEKVCFFGLMLGTLATKKQSRVQMVFLNSPKSPHHILGKAVRSCQILTLRSWRSTYQTGILNKSTFLPSL